MFEKNKEIEIDKNDIFKNDKLRRKEQIEDLSRIISSCDEPFVLSINSNWGSGKTTFIKLWKIYLEKEMNINSIYFSAWEDDFSSDPLISILGEFKSYINKEFSSNSIVEEKYEKIKNLGGKVIKRGLPAFIKGSTMGALDIDKGFENALGAISEETAKELIDNYSKDKALTNDFKETIQELLENIKDNKPFVIFIDELDRCRPLYSIELLEKIKHFFGIKGLIFILSIDKEQLSESIKSQYGNINATKYLKRFIDLEYELKNNNINEFCDCLYEKFKFNEKLSLKEINIQLSEHDSFHYLSILKNMVNILDLSLRDIEQLFTKLDLFFKTIPKRFRESHFKVCIFFEVLKSYNSKIYYDFIYKGLNKDKIRDLLLDKIVHNESIYGDINLFFEVVILTTNLSEEKFNELITKESNKLLDIQDKSSYHYLKQNHIVKLLKIDYGEWGDYRLNKLIGTVIKKIEFIDRFSID